MRYSYEFKKECVELYRQGKWADTPPGLSDDSFRSKVRRWRRIEDLYGPEALKPKHSYKTYSPDEKLRIVSEVLAGRSCLEVSIDNGVENTMLHQWVRKYKNEGYNGLVNKKNGRKPKGPEHMRKTNPAPLTASEREELIRLRAENKYIKAENEVIKKEIALREEKQAALLKARKQRSSKNSEKKDID
jgi:transposase-like protein